MTFQLIKGTFHVKGYYPDGDSIRFQADDPNNWKKLLGPAVELNARGHAQLRMEAIDALETHFMGTHQPLKYARVATRFLLSGLGIDDVVWNESKGRVVEAKDGTRGYILSRASEKNRRPVAFVFGGETKVADGQDVFLDRGAIKNCMNYRILAEGLAYPTYYNGLFSDLRSEFDKAVIRARKAGSGVWSLDKTNCGFMISNLSTLTDQIVVFPKLFRRMAEFMSDGGEIEGFKEFLAKRCEPVLDIPRAHFARFDNIIDTDGGVIKMKAAPEDIMFMDKIICKS
jgi:endonuclease YncB( thermonuclease family)